MNIPERIAKLRSLMEEKNIDAYIIPSADNHQSEYVGEYFKARAFITGFTGSAGTAIITKHDAGLWTDGRYFIQAQMQIMDSGIKLFKMEIKGVPTIHEFLESVIPEKGTLAFDGRVISKEEGEELKRRLSYKNVKIEYSNDLISMIWKDRPSLSQEPAFFLEEKYSGESTSSKITRLRKVMSEASATSHVITTLDDAAWLLNFRGRDVTYAPLVLCYVLLTMNDIKLYINRNKLNEKIKCELDKVGVVLKPYNDIYEDIKNLNKDEVLLIDPERINYTLYNNIPKNIKKVEMENPTIVFKGIKNEIEIENIRNAHIKDGVACTKFMYWLKNNVGLEKITEITAGEKLESFRREQEGYLWPSFSPICAYGEHAAMMHYSSTTETDIELLPKHLFLADTGGNYYEGSTDITRTYALGELSDELKTHFTAVVRGMINLSRAKFLYGSKGYNLDILARGPIWDLNIDYKCGTGHGVGYLLNIHEGPCGFRWQVVPSKHETHILESGMVITNEPGIYIENSHGIRIENELLICKGEENTFGQFMHMETITFVPIDLDAINKEELNKDEMEFLNNYHKMVYDKISPYLNEEEVKWLKNYTREL